MCIRDRLSVEGGRALITKDTVTILNRLEKTYTQFPISDLEEKYGIRPDFSYIQDMLLGFTPEMIRSDITDVEQGEDIITITSIIQDIYHQFFVSKIDATTRGGLFNEKIRADGTWEYSEHAIVNNDIFLPYNRKYKFQVDGAGQFDLDLKFSEIELDNPKAIKFSIPDHYTKE